LVISKEGNERGAVCANGRTGTVWALSEVGVLMPPSKKRKKPTSRPKPEDLLTQLSIKVYEPPLSELRDSGAIADLSRPISVVMLIIDFETEVAMNGIADFIGNSTGRHAAETVLALERVGCADEAALLERILAVASRAGMTHESMQADRADLASSTVASFNRVHGSKWHAAHENIAELCDGIDFKKVRKHTKAFVTEHQDALSRELGR
jgi:hypothetical protein